MKTPIQELIEKWETLNLLYTAKFIRDAKESLEKEKQAIIGAYDACEYNQNHSVKEIDGEQYYNDTFKQ